MKRKLIFLLVTLWTLSAHAFNWQDLWFTPDQQGQKLMAKNQYKKAKETFTRSDWAAAAAYRSGDYQRALELYQNLKNEQGYYNQGNTLAHMGQYEKAIKAYNKALAINANNQDALYNRKLVENLLKKDKEKQNKDQQSKDQNKDQQNKEQQNKDQQNKDQQSKDQQSKEQQNKEQQNKEQQNKEQQNKEQQNKEQQNKEQQSKEQQSKEQQSKEQQNKEQQAKKKQENKNIKNSETLASEREKQKAKEQWLRLIPDDPGGLLREKFLRDHLRRERGWYQ